MTDTEYDTAKKRVHRVWNEYSQVLGLGWFKVTIEWERQPREDNPQTLGCVKTDWEYRQATVHLYLTQLSVLSDEELKDSLIHEMCHILLGSTQAKDFTDLTDAEIDKEEYATELVARALQWALEYVPGGKSDKVIKKKKEKAGE